MKTILGSLILLIGFSGQAQTCTVACTVRYTIAIGSFNGEGRDCVEARNQADMQCARQGGFARRGTCAQTPNHAVTRNDCFKNLSDSQFGEITVDSTGDANQAASQYCENFCNGFGPNESLSCENGGMVCQNAR